MAFRILIWATRRMIISITKRCTQSRLLGGNEELSFGLIKCMVSTGRCPEVSDKYGSVAQGEFCAGDNGFIRHGELELRKKKRCCCVTANSLR